MVRTTVTVAVQATLNRAVLAKAKAKDTKDEVKVKAKDEAMADEAMVKGKAESIERPVAVTTTGLRQL